MTDDWITLAARCIVDNFAGVSAGDHERIAQRFASIIRPFAEPLVALLRESKREHYHCDDSYYCCGKCKSTDHGPLTGEDRTLYGPGGTCTCGADAWNARVDALLNP